MAKIVGIDGKEVKADAVEAPAKDTPTAFWWEVSEETDQGQPLLVYGVIGMNPIFVYFADLNGDILLIVPMDKLVSVVRCENQDPEANEQE